MADAVVPLAELQLVQAGLDALPQLGAVPERDVVQRMVGLLPALGRHLGHREHDGGLPAELHDGQPILRAEGVDHGADGVLRDVQHREAVALCVAAHDLGLHCHRPGYVDHADNVRRGAPRRLCRAHCDQHGHPAVGQGRAHRVLHPDVGLLLGLRDLLLRHLTPVVEHPCCVHRPLLFLVVFLILGVLRTRLLVVVLPALAAWSVGVVASLLAAGAPHRNWR